MALVLARQSGEIVLNGDHGEGGGQILRSGVALAAAVVAEKGNLAINCQYCHSSVEKSKHAGIPSANVCMNCHKAVSEGKNTGTAEIAKIYAAVGWDPAKQEYTGKEEPIRWVKVHNLPDHAFFSHAQHVAVHAAQRRRLHCADARVAQHSPRRAVEERARLDVLDHDALRSVERGAAGRGAVRPDDGEEVREVGGEAVVRREAQRSRRGLEELQRSARRAGQHERGGEDLVETLLQRRAGARAAPADRHEPGQRLVVERELHAGLGLGRDVESRADDAAHGAVGLVQRHRAHQDLRAPAVTELELDGLAEHGTSGATGALHRQVGGRDDAAVAADAEQVGAFGRRSARRQVAAGRAEDRVGGGVPHDDVARRVAPEPHRDRQRRQHRLELRGARSGEILGCLASSDLPLECARALVDAQQRVTQQDRDGRDARGDRGEQAHRYGVEREPRGVRERLRHEDRRAEDDGGEDRGHGPRRSAEDGGDQHAQEVRRPAQIAAELRDEDAARERRRDRAGEADRGAGDVRARREHDGHEPRQPRAGARRESVERRTKRSHRSGVPARTALARSAGCVPGSPLCRSRSSRKGVR